MRLFLPVLDWGLGHASRSLALIDRLEREGHEIYLGSSGRAQTMLRLERPGLECFDLPAYDVRYPTDSMALNVARQLPKWWRTVRAEQRATTQLVRNLGIDRIISDSRFGCYVPGTESILLTHQLHPIFDFTPLSKAYTYWLQRFDEIWVPDHPGPDRISGKLSDPVGYRDVKFIGPLSRLMPTNPPPSTDLLVLLSGPEPARTKLEQKLLRELNERKESCVFVRGLPGRNLPPLPKVRPGVTVVNFMPTPVLGPHLNGAATVVCRSGYSTIMDLVALGKRAILIPTPGQTEQIYLGARAREQGWAVTVPQSAERLLP